MEVKRFDIFYRKSQEIRIHVIGDIHAGIKHCAETLIKNRIAEIKADPNAYWIGMGDYAEFITPSDPRYDIGVIADWVHKENIAHDEEEWVVNLFKPITKKCIGLLEGNHEDAHRIHKNGYVQKNICEKLKVDDLGTTCLIRFIFKRKNSTESHVIKGVFAHGAGWAITKGTKMNRLEKFMNIFPTCQIVAMGHMHDKIAHELPYLDITDSDNITDCVRVGAVTGSWFKTYEQGVRASYGEKKGFPPCVLGSPVFVIKPSSNKVWVE